MVIDNFLSTMTPGTPCKPREFPLCADREQGGRRWWK